MNTIGLIGGTTWHSTVEYYRLLNELTAKQLGGTHSAKCILYSVDFAEIQELIKEPDFKVLTAMMIDVAQKLQLCGAERLVLCANTLHAMADKIQQAIDIPIVHIGEATAAEIRAKGLRKVGLLGTKITMEQDFIKAKLRQANIESLVPELEDRDFMQQVIINELSRGVFLPETKRRFIRIIQSLVALGAEGMILGCTEIPLIIKQEDCTVPVFDTLQIHVEAALTF